MPKTKSIKEAKINLDLSFQDAMKKALNTPLSEELKPTKKKEIKKLDGK